MPLSLADIRVWYPWGSPWVEITDETDVYPVPTRVDSTNADLNARLRKMTLEFDSFVSSVRHDDLMLTGMHLIDARATPNWNSTAFELAEAAVDTFWNAIKSQFPTVTRLAGITWHRAGPGYDPPASPGPAVRRVTRNLPGTHATPNPPARQVALSITERTMIRKRWGRLYLPGPAGQRFVTTTPGRFDPAMLVTIADAAAALYGALATADLPVVVYSRAQPSRSKKSGAALPAKPAGALKVNTLQIDDVPDVIRSRRLKQPTVRERRGLAVT